MHWIDAVIVNAKSLQHEGVSVAPRIGDAIRTRMAERTATVDRSSVSEAVVAAMNA